ncbi:MAG: hypothetical protein ABIS50_19815 [Luteolibacter sp.]|uniref:hypothetical protein n=1 Tax=Luteolibacter sp. TaxID=1962973 RepID=UPI003263E37F
MKKLILKILVLGAFSPVLLAQDIRKVQLRTLCLEQIKDLEKVVLAAGDGKSKGQDVILYTDISPVIEGSFTTNEAIFYIEKTGPDGKPLQVPVGKATLGKSARQLFLFVPGGTGEGKLPYQVIAYDDDLKSFAMGSVRAINLAPVPVRFVLAGEVTPQIPPGRFAQFPHATKVDDYNMYPVVIEFLSANGEWVKGQSVSWKASDQKREVVVTLVDMKYKQPSVQNFADFPPWNGQ